MSKITESARGERCAMRLPGCCGERDTTVFAHIRKHGAAGIGQKPSDLHGVYACHHCHDIIDGRKGSQVPPVVVASEILRALMETQRKLVDKGLISCR